VGWPPATAPVHPACCAAGPAPPPRAAHGFPAPARGALESSAGSRTRHPTAAAATIVSWPVIPLADALARYDLVVSMRAKVSRPDYHPTGVARRSGRKWRRRSARPPGATWAFTQHVQKTGL